MISVPCGTGDISFDMISHCHAMIYAYGISWNGYYIFIIAICSDIDIRKAAVI